MFGYTYEDVNKNCNGKNFEQTVEQAIKDSKRENSLEKVLYTL